MEVMEINVNQAGGAGKKELEYSALNIVAVSDAKSLQVIKIKEKKKIK